MVSYIFWAVQARSVADEEFVHGSKNKTKEKKDSCVMSSPVDQKSPCCDECNCSNGQGELLLMFAMGMAFTEAATSSHIWCTATLLARRHLSPVDLNRLVGSLGKAQLRGNQIRVYNKTKTHFQRAKKREKKWETDSITFLRTGNWSERVGESEEDTGPLTERPTKESPQLRPL